MVSYKYHCHFIQYHTIKITINYHTMPLPLPFHALSYHYYCISIHHIITITIHHHYILYHAITIAILFRSGIYLAWWSTKETWPGEADDIYIRYEIFINAFMWTAAADAFIGQNFCRAGLGQRHENPFYGFCNNSHSQHTRLLDMACKMYAWKKWHIFFQK